MPSSPGLRGDEAVGRCPAPCPGEPLGKGSSLAVLFFFLHFKYGGDTLAEEVVFVSPAVPAGSPCIRTDPLGTAVGKVQGTEGVLPGDEDVDIQLMPAGGRLAQPKSVGRIGQISYFLSSKRTAITAAR